MNKDEIKDVIHTFAYQVIDLSNEEEFPYQHQLNLVGEKLLVPVLIECLNDPEDEVRRLSMSLLCELKETAEPALPIMIDALKDSCKIVRLNAASAVARFGEKAKTAVPILETWNERKDEFDYITAIESILYIDPTRVNNLLPLLIEVLGMEDCFSRSHAIWVVGDLGENAQEAVSALKYLLHAHSTDSMAASDAIFSITNDPSDSIKVGLDLLDHDEWLQRYCGAEHLRLLGSKAHSAVPHLRLVLENDENEAVRNEAERALKEIEGSNSSDQKMT